MLAAMDANPANRPSKQDELDGSEPLGESPVLDPLPAVDARYLDKELHELRLRDAPCVRDELGRTRGAA